MKLCRPCAEAMRKQGHVLVGKTLGVNVKVTCERCGKRRYGKEYKKG